MGQGAHTTDAERNVILKLKSDGLSLGKIAQIMKCSKHKVFNVIYYTKISKLEEERGKRYCLSVLTKY